MPEERPLQSVLDRIVMDTRTRTDAILADARARAKGIVERAEAEDRTRAEAELKAARERFEAHLNQETSSARLETKKTILEARRKAMDDLREDVLAHLRDIPPSERGKLLKGLLAKAASVIPGGEVRCGASDERFVREDGRYGIAGRIDPPGGIVVIDQTGERVIDLRLVTLVDRAIESTHEEIERALFGGADG
jgi:V/A-type H+-transporting ATPase subunit E